MHFILLITILLNKYQIKMNDSSMSTQILNWNNTYKIEREIGRGSFSHVFAVKNKKGE